MAEPSEEGEEYIGGESAGPRRRRNTTVAEESVGPGRYSSTRERRQGIQGRGLFNRKVQNQVCVF